MPRAPRAPLAAIGNELRRSRSSAAPYAKTSTTAKRQGGASVTKKSGAQDKLPQPSAGIKSPSAAIALKEPKSEHNSKKFSAPKSSRVIKALRLVHTRLQKHRGRYDLPKLVTICIGVCDGSATYNVIHQFVKHWGENVDEPEFENMVRPDATIVSRRTGLLPSPPVNQVTVNVRSTIAKLLGPIPDEDLSTLDDHVFTYDTAHEELDSDRPWIYESYLQAVRLVWN